jgi:hypothetical protein
LVFWDSTVSTSSSTGAPWGRSAGRPYSLASRSVILRSLRRSAIAGRMV